MPHSLRKAQAIAAKRLAAPIRSYPFVGLCDRGFLFSKKHLPPSDERLRPADTSLDQIPGAIEVLGSGAQCATVKKGQEGGCVLTSGANGALWTRDVLEDRSLIFNCYQFSRGVKGERPRSRRWVNADQCLCVDDRDKICDPTLVYSFSFSERSDEEATQSNKDISARNPKIPLVKGTGLESRAPL